MPPKFGTSGLRGLVVELTEDLVSRHIKAFISSCPTGTGIFVGRDLRPSSKSISEMVCDAATKAGVNVWDCGEILTPALALSSMDANAAAVMITGSHIPADRNGLKFYTPEGEITKSQEQDILLNLNQGQEQTTTLGSCEMLDIEDVFVERFVSAFGKDALSDLNVGVYSHSTVGRDTLITLLNALGARVSEVGRSEVFIPVDTEAVSSEMREALKGWVAERNLDAIVSMDGDGDRPLVVDESGNVVVGDVLGQIASTLLKAENVVTPISSNSGIDQLGFSDVQRTKIGSPFVIEGMSKVGGNVVGYEANGGFLLGFDAAGPGGTLKKLMTRDSILPIISVLYLSKLSSVSILVASQPRRFTAADRLTEVPTEKSLALVQSLKVDPTPLIREFDSAIDSINTLDGLRITLKNARVLHLRPSGNAPEFRFYVEAESHEIAKSTLKVGLGILKKLLA